MFRNFSALIVVLTASISFAQTSELIEIKRNGKTVSRVKYDFWSLEYPGPVIDVSKKKPGTTVVTIEKSLIDLGKTASCRIKNGLYHPWSTTPNSLAKSDRYITITPIKEYRVRRAHDMIIPEYTEQRGNFDSTLRLNRGDIFTRVIYLSEGFCSAEYVSRKGARREIESIECSVFDNTRLYAETPNSVRAPKDEYPAPGTEQWISLTCIDGTKGFIRDEALLATPGVKEGRITGYGSVGSEDDPEVVGENE